jgi:hypothetical protein
LNQASANTYIDHIIIIVCDLNSVPQAYAYCVHFGRLDNDTSHNRLHVEMSLFVVLLVRGAALRCSYSVPSLASIQNTSYHEILQVFMV